MQCILEFSMPGRCLISAWRGKIGNNDLFRPCASCGGCGSAFLPYWEGSRLPSQSLLELRPHLPPAGAPGLCAGLSSSLAVSELSIQLIPNRTRRPAGALLDTRSAECISLRRALRFRWEPSAIYSLEQQHRDAPYRRRPWRRRSLRNHARLRGIRVVDGCPQRRRLPGRRGYGPNTV